MKYKPLLITIYFCFLYCVFLQNVSASERSIHALIHLPKIIHDHLKDGSTGPALIKILPGKFIMGSDNVLSAGYEKPPHGVSIPYAFYLGQYPVTFAEYDAYCKTTGKPLVDDYHWGRGQRPVINVSLQDAKDYARWLSQQTGHHYRLPSEAEWEYAARAGTTTHYYWGDELKPGMANCRHCGSRWDNKMTAPVGQFPPNAWGLYDMLGNVWELTGDCWNFTYDGAPTNGSAWHTGDCRRTVLKGGSWGDIPKDMRTATRLRSYIGTRMVTIGFRLVREN